MQERECYELIYQKLKMDIKQDHLVLGYNMIHMHLIEGLKMSLLNSHESKKLRLTDNSTLQSQQNIQAIQFKYYFDSAYFNTTKLTI